MDLGAILHRLRETYVLVGFRESVGGAHIAHDCFTNAVS